MISSISYNQIEIIRNILNLHCPDGIELDPTYSKGNFYKNNIIPQPDLKFDIQPQTSETMQGNANNIPLPSSTIRSIMFDPPFVVSGKPKKNNGIIRNRFGTFSTMRILWNWYHECIIEFYRLLQIKGVLIFKCQDSVSCGKQWISHNYIINEAEKAGFYTKDLFLLLAKNRIVDPKWKVQKHARKFHSYFLVFEKQSKG